MTENIPPAHFYPTNPSNKCSDHHINFSNFFHREGQDLYTKMNDKEKELFNDFQRRINESAQKSLQTTQVLSNHNGAAPTSEHPTQFKLESEDSERSQ